MSGQIGGAVFGATKLWVITVVGAVALGGVQMGTDWANFSGKIGFNGLGIVATALKSSGGWFKEGQGAPPAAAPVNPASPSAPATVATPPLVPVAGR